jgi:HEAT repeat protein
MGDFLLFCKQLAEGTGKQKRLAWKSLVDEGGLWRGCLEALRQPSSIDLLSRSYEYLQRSWDRSPIVQARWGDAGAVEQLIAAMGRIVAAAAAAAHARFAPDDPAGLERWALRSLEESSEFRRPEGTRSSELGNPLLPTRNSELRTRNSEPETRNSADEETRLRCCFQSLAGRLPHPTPALASAQDVGLSLLQATFGKTARSTPLPRLRVPVLLARGDEGFLAWLWLERRSGGFGQFFQAPAALLDPVQPDLRQAVEASWRHATLRHPVPPTALSHEDVRWWLTDLPRTPDGRVVPVQGASIQGAAVVGLLLLLQGQPYDITCAVSATVSEDGSLHPVDGIEGSTTADSPKLTAALSLRPRNGPATVVVSPGNRLPEAAQARWEAQDLRIAVAETVDEALPLASGLVAGVCRLLEGEVRWVLEDAGRATGRELRDWAALDRLFVPVRVGRGARGAVSPVTPVPPRDRTGVDHDHDHDYDHEGNAPFPCHPVTLPPPHPLTPSPLHPVAPAEWQALRDDLKRAVVLGDPGCGKTTLLWHEAGRRNQEALTRVRAQTGPVQHLSFAAFVRAAELAEDLTTSLQFRVPPPRGHPEFRVREPASPNSELGTQNSELRTRHPDADTLPEALAARLEARHRLDGQTLALLREKLRNGDCLIVIDALDEVPSGEPHRMRSRLDTALTEFARAFPARLLVSSRWAGYTHSPPSLPVEDELELLPLDGRQIQETVDRWLADDERSGRDVWRHLWSQERIRAILSSPLLLRLACQAVRAAQRDGRSLPRWERRTELYETFLSHAFQEWSRRADPRPDREQCIAFRRFAADLAEALWRRDARRSLWTPAEIGDAIAGARAPYPALNDPASSGGGRRPLLEDLCAAGILSPAGPDGPSAPLTFPHRTFGEYLAACALADRLESGAGLGRMKAEGVPKDEGGRMKDEEDRIHPSSFRLHPSETWTYIDRKAWDPDWETVLLFLAGRLRDPLPLLERLRGARSAERGAGGAERPGIGTPCAPAKRAPGAKRPAPNPPGDDLFHHRLALAGQCLPEIAPEIRRTQATAIDGITSEAFHAWWDLRLENPEAAALNRISHALPALGQAGGRVHGLPLSEWLCRRLRDADPKVSEAAAEGVAAVGRGGAAPAVLHCLAELLARGAERLASERQSVRASEREVGSHAPTLPPGWKAALQAVMGMGSAAAEPVILERLADLARDEERWREAALAIRCMGSAAATPELLLQLTFLLGDEEAGVRQAAARTLAGLGSAGAKPAILDLLPQLLRDRHLTVRQAAMEAVIGLGQAAKTGEILVALAELLSHEDAALRQAAAEALGSFGSRPTAQSLTQLASLLDLPGSMGSAMWSATACCRGPATAESATGYSGTPRRQQDPQAGTPALHNEPRQQAVALQNEELAELLKHPVPGLRQAAAAMLAGMDRVPAAPGVLAGLTAMLGDDDPVMRGAAALAAGALGAGITGEIVAGLLDLLHGEDLPARRAAADACARLMAGGVRIFRGPAGAWQALDALELAEQRSG